MAVVATVVIVAIAFLQSQSAGLLAAENAQASDRAMQAAEAGIAAGLDAIQTPGWSGVSAPLHADVLSDSRGTASYTVTFSQIASDGTAGGVATAVLSLRVRSVGAWLATESSRPVERTLETLVTLKPRLAGRPSRPGDESATSDRSSDAPGFGATQNYTVFVADGSAYVAVAPQTRITGNVWVGDRLDLYSGLNWNSTVRAALLTGLGIDNGGGAAAAIPHPVAGSMNFYTAPDSALASDLNLLNIPFSPSPTWLALPSFDPSHFLKYRLFEGGFQYNAVQIGSSLTSSQNSMLHPTESNPLGIFYCNGSLSVQNGVVVNGTLVASSGIDFEGRGVAIVPHDWRDGSGGSTVTDRDLWPVLPAVAAGGNVKFRSTSQVFVEGAVASQGDIVVETPDFSQEPSLLNYDGHAVATPLGNGVSQVRVTDLLALLSGLTINTNHAVQFLNGGVWSEWYPVVSGDLLTGKFLVRGTASYTAATSCRFRPRRVYHVDVIGPVIAKRIQLKNPPAWSSVSTSGWTAKYNTWIDRRDGLLVLGIRIGGNRDLTFSQSLAQDNFPLEPTVRISRSPSVNYACEPPLFRPDASPRSAGGGYRWQVASWGEVSP
jgi:hypothetical protein